MGMLRLRQTAKSFSSFEQPEDLFATGADRDRFPVIEPHEDVQPFLHPLRLRDLD